MYPGLGLQRQLIWTHLFLEGLLEGSAEFVCLVRVTVQLAKLYDGQGIQHCGGDASE